MYVRYLSSTRYGRIPSSSKTVAANFTVVSHLSHSLARSLCFLLFVCLFVLSLFLALIVGVISADAALNSAPSNGWFGGRGGLALVVKGNKKSGKQLLCNTCVDIIHV